MSNSSKDNSNPSSIVDVDLVRAYDGATIGVTVYDYDFSDVDNLTHQGYEVTSVTIL